MAKVDVGGCELWYRIVGDGPPLVQIGGAISAHEGYETITEAMAQHFSVIEYDHRGYGSSDRPEGQAYTMKVWSDDLAALLTALGVERCHVHGGSMGGFIASRFAADHPERVDRLVISGAVAKCDRMARFQLEVWKMVARAYGVDSTELAIELCTKAFSRGYLDTVGDDALEEIRAVTARNVTTEVFVAACDAMIEADVTDVLARISAPTLVLVGSEDILTPLDTGPDGAGVRAIAAGIAGARLHVFEGCGHGNLVERARESEAVILEFLRAS